MAMRFANLIILLAFKCVGHKKVNLFREILDYRKISKKLLHLAPIQLLNAI